MYMYMYVFDYNASPVACSKADKCITGCPMVSFND